MSKIKDCLLNIKQKFQDVSFEALLWLVNLVPGLVGITIGGDRMKAPFWIVHLSLLAYVYGVGNAVYQWKYANEAGDYIKSNINVSLLLLITNISIWYLTKRSELNVTLKAIRLNDELSRRSDSSQKKHKALLTVIKRIMLTFYVLNYIDSAFIYLPNRVDVMNDYAMTPCVGMGTLTSAPTKQICMIILLAQEWSIMTVVLNYQALLIFLIAHTAAMYQILADEMMAFNNYKDLKEHKAFVKETLPSLIGRHSLTLNVICKLKSLYSLSLGINFGSHAICILLILYLPLEEWYVFLPISVYCVLVFFLYCFLCQKLVDASELFERAVYCCGWENFALNEQKMIFMMLCQSQQSVEVLAANIIPINIYTFGTTLQAMYKFVTVVKI